MPPTSPRSHCSRCWALNYTRVIHGVASAAFEAGIEGVAPELESLLREKTLAPDFRYPHASGKLSLARLLSLQRRFEEAVDAFASARIALEEDGAMPLRAIADRDEAVTLVRRGATGDRNRARELVELALDQFREIGMPGWIDRIASLLD